MLTPITLQPHPALAPWPVNEDLIEQLVTSIDEYGFDPAYPIDICEGEILDGRARLAALKRLGIKPEPGVHLREVDPSQEARELWHRVAIFNAVRRHLTKSQRAVIALDYLPEFEAEAQQRMLEGNASGNDGDKTSRGRASTLVAKLFGISGSLVKQAKRVLKHLPELIEEIRRGAITVTAALSKVQEHLGEKPPKQPRINLRFDPSEQALVDEVMAFYKTQGLSLSARLMELLRREHARITEGVWIDEEERQRAYGAVGSMSTKVEPFPTAPLRIQESPTTSGEQPVEDDELLDEADLLDDDTGDESLALDDDEILDDQTARVLVAKYNEAVECWQASHPDAKAKPHRSRKKPGRALRSRLALAWAACPDMATWDEAFDALSKLTPGAVRRAKLHNLTRLLGPKTSDPNGPLILFQLVAWVGWDPDTQQHPTPSPPRRAAPSHNTNNPRGISTTPPPHDGPPPCPQTVKVPTPDALSSLDEAAIQSIAKKIILPKRKVTDLEGEIQRAHDAWAQAFEKSTGEKGPRLDKRARLRLQIRLSSVPDFDTFCDALELAGRRQVSIEEMLKTRIHLMSWLQAADST